MDTSTIGATCRSIYSTTCVYERSSCVFGWKCLHPNGDRDSRRTRTETHRNRIRSFVVDTSRLLDWQYDVVSRYQNVWLCLCTPAMRVRVGVRDGLCVRVGWLLTYPHVFHQRVHGCRSRPFETVVILPQPTASRTTAVEDHHRPVALCHVNGEQH